MCRGKIGQNPKIGQFWRPVALEPYVVQKSWPGLGNSLSLGLQYGVNSISLQSIPWPVACCEWGAFWPPPSLGFWGQMTPKWKLFLNLFPKSAFQLRFTCSGQIWRKSAVAKLPKSHLVLLTKNPASGILLSPSPFRPHLTDRAQNFVNVVGPWPVDVYRLWSGLAAVCRTYSGKSPKKLIQYRLSAYNYNRLLAHNNIGWKPAMRAFSLQLNDFRYV